MLNPEERLANFILVSVRKKNSSSNRHVVLIRHKSGLQQPGNLNRRR